jgi:hypothetical protein
VLGEGEGASAALGRKRKGRGRQALSVEVKIHLTLPVGFIDPWSPAPRIARSACINYRRTARSLTGRAHHNRSGQAHASAQSLRRGNRRAAVGRHVRPPTSPTTRTAVAPEKARPQRTTVGIKWPGPLPRKDDPRACDYRPVASKPAQRERVPQVPSIYKDY